MAGNTRAGEPHRGDQDTQNEAVYPRPCGGAQISLISDVTSSGLSPPVRGSRTQSRPDSLAKGSIPARAGEPPWRPKGRTLRRVYPRPCGGAESITRRAVHNSGLSPPVRGSHLGLDRLERNDGSIPARAGEPLFRSWGRSSLRVYPRPCGGPRREGLQVHVEGSIPARAGEPGRFRGEDDVGGGLSPPVRGSPDRTRSRDAHGGLSPPVRGNRRQRSRSHHHPHRVYPRPCGGALSIATRSAAMWVYPRPCGGAPWTREPMALA